MVNTWGDQPRMTVWPVSTTCERPRRRSLSRPSRPLASTPISALTMKMPPRVMANPTSRNDHPVSPATVPVSTVRMVTCQSASAKLSSSPPAGLRRASTRIKVPTRIKRNVTANKAPTRAIVPRDMKVSNR